MSMRRGDLAAIGFGLALLITGCVKSIEVDIDDLQSDPRSYQNKEVCTEGIYASGFEVNALAASTYREGDAVYLTQPAIWIEGAQIRSTTDCFMSGTTPPIEFCKVIVCGFFEFGGRYGHLGGYEYQLRGADY